MESSQSGSDALSLGTDKSSLSVLTGNGGTLVEGTNTALVSAVSVTGKICIRKTFINFLFCNTAIISQKLYQALDKIAV